MGRPRITCFPAPDHVSPAPDHVSPARPRITYGVRGRISGARGPDSGPGSRTVPGPGRPRITCRVGPGSRIAAGVFRPRITYRRPRKSAPDHVSRRASFRQGKICGPAPDHVSRPMSAGSGVVLSTRPRITYPRIGPGAEATATGAGNRPRITHGVLTARVSRGEGGEGGISRRLPGGDGSGNGPSAYAQRPPPPPARPPLPRAPAAPW